jgi:hypothetical protein
MGVDPGETTGWARFKDGELVEYGEVKYHEFYIWLEQQTPNFWVVEDYIVRAGPAARGFNHEWNKGVPLRIIGALLFQAQRTGAVIALQQPSLKPGAYAQMGAEYVKGKRNMHHMDAIAHGSWFIRHKITKELLG